MILVEIRPTRNVAYRSNSGVNFVFNTDNRFAEVVESNTYYLSLNGVALEHFWEPYIVSFSSPQYAIDSDHGGFCRMTFGSISLSPKVFESEWPPPASCRILVKYTATTEDVAITLIDSDIYLEGFDEESVRYSINTPKFTQRLLDEGLDYNGNTVPYPKAFGTVTHMTPVRVADTDIGGVLYPTYHLAGLGTGTVSRKIVCFDSYDSGNQTKVTCANNHEWSNGTTIVIAGSTNFNGSHEISNASGKVFVIDVAFPTDNSEKLPVIASAYTPTSFIVYDGGLPMDEDDVVVQGDGTFYLGVTPSSTIVTISGTAAENTLEDVATWVQERLGLGSIDFDYSRVSSPEVSVWANSQMPVVDFLSDICAFFTHYFFIKSGILYVGDMLIDRGSETLDEFDYFDAVYNAPRPIRQLKSTWTTYEADLLNADNNFTVATSYVKPTNHSIVESLYEVTSGTADGTGARRLIDSGATFSDDGVRIGDVVQNTTDNTSSTVVAVNQTWLELQDDIFVSGDTYSIGPSFPYGQDLQITPYHDTESNVKTALQNILSILTKTQAEIRIPISETLPDPGKKLTWGDEILVVDTETWVRARRLSYDVENEEIVIIGEGVST